MKRWFNPWITTGELWEWDSEHCVGHWVNSHTGARTKISGLHIDDFLTYEEVFPVWIYPRELRVPEGL